MRRASTGVAMMNAANPFLDRTPAPLGPRPATLAEAWDRARQFLTWRRCAWVTSLGLLLGVLVPLQDLHISFYFTPWKIVYQTPFYVAFTWVFLLAIAAVEASVPRGRWPSPWRYFAAAVAASVVCIGLAWSFSDQLRLAPQRVVSGGSRNIQKSLDARNRTNIAVFLVGFDGVVYGWFATFIYVALRNARQAARALAEAEVGRSEANRSLLVSQLAAAHARVDPAVVFRALEDIERTYEEDPARADAGLDELIARLRAAIPRLRADGSGREVGDESASRSR